MLSLGARGQMPGAKSKEREKRKEKIEGSPLFSLSSFLSATPHLLPLALTLNFEL
jgi:hypothetical protein